MFSWLNCNNRSFSNTACKCDPDGSNSTTCDGQNGQCPCKPGVMLQDCSMCKVYHYGFSSGNGCTGKTLT